MSSSLCTSCQKQTASVHVLDLDSGYVLKGKQQLCQACAETAGVVQSKLAKAKPMSAEILEDLIGTMTGDKSKLRGRGAGPACPACGTTLGDFKMRGRFGCGRCYDTFRAALIPLLERVHDAPRHQGRFPARSPAVRARPETVADLRRRLEAAITGEKYEEAAQLRDQLRSLEASNAPKSDPA
jgi:protein arginine kinase activator